MRVFLLAVVCAISCVQLAICGDLTDKITTEAQFLLADAENIKRVTKHDESIAEAAFKRRHDSYSTKNLMILTDKNFREVIDLPTALALFYYRFEAKSQLTLQVFAKAADKLKSDGVPVTLAAIDCFDWTDVCDKAKVATFPTILAHRRDAAKPDRYTGVISPSAIAAAAKRYQKGEALDAAPEIEKFAELDFTQFPRLISTRKPFVIVFTNGASKTLGPIIGSIATKAAIFTWLDTSKSDGVAKNILSHHVSDAKSEELLVIDHGKGTVHRFTGNVNADAVKKWVAGVLSGDISPSNRLTEKEWKPRQAGFDFLRLMDLEAANRPRLTEAEEYINKLNDEGLSKDEDPIPRFILESKGGTAPQIGTIHTEL